jgi:Uma2 family endonuclease
MIRVWGNISGAATEPTIHHGLRMTADEYFELPEDENWYELIDGVVCMSPSPIPKHQFLAFQIVKQIDAHLEKHPTGYVFQDVDVRLGEGPRGGDLVYRPDVVFVRKDPSGKMPDRIVGAPALIVEVASSSSRRMDRETKFADYERVGVGEYWIIDPQHKACSFYRLADGRYADVTPASDSFVSQSIPGFVLDLKRIRGAWDA